MPAIHVGVITYDNTTEQLEKLGRSLDRSIARAALPAGGVALSVIDNGEASVWPALETPIRFRQGFENIGFSAGANRLLATLRDDGGDLLLLVNPDGALHPDCLAELLAVHARHPADLVEAKQFPEEHPKHYDPISGRTGWCSGACLLIPAATAAAVGGFDEQFFLYMEDIDFSWRVREAGFGTRMAPRALFMHDILDRVPSRKALEWNLLSQRAFGWKWHDRTLVTSAEKALVQEGFVKDAADLPPLPNQGGRLSPRAWRVRDVADHRYFSPGRW